MNLAVRISRPYADIFDWIDNIPADRIAVYEHEADDEVKRTHVHMMIIGCTLKTDAMKTRFKKLYGDIDKTDWSFKASDGDTKFITYMSKGILPPKLTKGYEVDEITKATAEWVDPKTVKLKLEDGRLVRESPEINQKTKSQLLELMRSKLCDTDTTRDILKIIRKVLVENHIIIGQYKVMDYYDSLMMYERKDEWITAIERKIKSRDGI